VKPQGILAGCAGTFVTLRTQDGDLRGCIGTVEPVCDTIAEEIIQNALSASLCDPRFAPVKSQELNGLIYGVDVLTPPETVRGLEDLNPSQFGIIIETIDGQQRGLLLPRIEGIETAEDQWYAVHRKADIKLGTPIKVERFTVTRFGKD